jgi:hypothetical protein
MTVSNIHTTRATLAAGTPVQLVGPSERYLLTLQVTGIGAASFGFGAAPAAGTGLSLDPASAAGGQGGIHDFADMIPSDSIWAISATGTTVVVLESFPTDDAHRAVDFDHHHYL